MTVDEYGPGGDALAPRAALGGHVAVVAVVAEELCRALLATPSARRSLEREDLGMTADLDRILVETALEHRMLRTPPALN